MKHCQDKKHTDIAKETITTNSGKVTITYRKPYTAPIIIKKRAGKNKAPKRTRAKVFKFQAKEQEIKDKEWKKIGRSYEKITHDDLRKLLKITKNDFNDLCKRIPKYKKLKLLAICLCQGGAQHYVDGKNGIRDFDTYLFFDNNCSVQFPPRRRGYHDFGVSKFGRTYFRPGHIQPKHERIKGRSIDVMGRSIEVIDDDYKKSIQKWLGEAKSETPYLLSKKAVVVLEPEEDLGEVIWTMINKI